MNNLQTQFQLEQESITQAEDRLAGEIQQLLSQLESDLLDAVTHHDPNEYTQIVARERHTSALMAAGGALW